MGLFSRKKADPRYFSACNFMPGPQGYGAAALDANGAIVWQRAMPARGHTLELSPDGTLCAIIDRKPGAAITFCRSEDGALLNRIAAADGHHFDGHAVFNRGGTLLYATESADADQAGRIAVFDIADGSRVAAFATHGIEPHELIWVEPDRALAVGNGGIRDRMAMEAEIESSLVLLDAGDGALLAKHELEADLNSLSIRHLAHSAAGEIVFAMQDQDAATEWRPMVGLLGPDGELTFLDLPLDDLMRLRGYCGSAAIDRSGTIAAVTSPHGGVAAFWHLPDRRYLGHVELRDCCGIAAAEECGSFVFTSGAGTRVLATAASHDVTALVLERPVNNLPQWDNHLTARGAGTANQ
ncbi:DUF1513 domain-containing protein [Dongia sedimenti]|uniref:DUF1513 domain-containing protein n=1 Tax=Dongia sedimenti TaxID=3064282 RepID=A0ABU0YT29_9PROT|nr:DUF1513 domain-containing protein [Rhodospirillaceae bacterium R-7]